MPHAGVSLLNVNPGNLTLATVAIDSGAYTLMLPNNSTNEVMEIGTGDFFGIANQTDSKIYIVFFEKAPGNNQLSHPFRDTGKYVILDHSLNPGNDPNPPTYGGEPIVTADPNVFYDYDVYAENNTRVSIPVLVKVGGVATLERPKIKVV